MGLAMAVGFAVPAGLQADWFSDERTLMGTSVRVELWAENALQARPAISAAFAEIARIGKRWRELVAT